MTARTSKNGKLLDPQNPETYKLFKAAAARMPKTREAALALLVKEGICTPTGRLTKRYR